MVADLRAPVDAAMTEMIVASVPSALTEPRSQLPAKTPKTKRKSKAVGIKNRAATLSFFHLRQQAQ